MWIKYLWPVLQINGGFEKVMKHEIKCDWRQASGVLFDKSINGTFYKIVVRSAMLYGLEC